MEKLLVALCTAPNEETAKALSQSILDARLAACVSRVPGVQSQYWWQGVLETAEETLLMIKTTAVQVDALKAHIQKHHPYETPELILYRLRRPLMPTRYGLIMRPDIRVCDVGLNISKK